MPYPIFHPDSTTESKLLLSAEEFAGAFPEEGQYVEFKEGVSAEKLREAVVGFSNADGGVVLIGVRNNGTPVGVTQPGERERAIHDALHGIHNPGRYDVSTLAVGDQTVLVLAVSRRHEGFAQLPNGSVRVRRGARNETLIGPDLSRFQQQRSFERFEDATTDAGVVDCDAGRIEQVRSELGVGPDVDTSQWLVERDLGRLVSGKLKLTVAGCLVLSREPERWVGRAGVEILRYSESEVEPDKRELVSGSIDDVVIETTDRILSELGEQSVLIGVTRVELPRLPVTAVREAVANAVAHRSYESKGTYIRVEVRPGSVSITSPGPLPEPVTIELIRDQQAARNPVILDYLRRAGLAEDLGRGIDRIEDEMQLDLLERPVFQELGSSVSVELLTRGSVSLKERAWVRNLIRSKHIEPRDAVVVLHAVRNEVVANGDVRELLSVDSIEARHILQRLRDEGVLEQLGERGGSTYRPTPLLGMPASHAAPDEQRLAVVVAARSRPISNADVRALLGVERPEALRILADLVETRQLNRQGQKRGTTYTAV